MMQDTSQKPVLIRDAELADLEALLELENLCFESDRLSRRSFQRWLKVDGRILSVIESDGQLIGYGLVLLHKGTRLARLYSIALNPAMRGRGLGRILMDSLEEQAMQDGRLFMRLEVSKKNLAAISLYTSLGYGIFGELPGYYEDHTDALRMQKRIRFPDATRKEAEIPWYRQTTQFTCGPASLMMAMSGIDRSLVLNQNLELDLWREATTIYMTSGHGGCHPLGLALSANKRGYNVEVYMSQTSTLFLDGVRVQHKKDILAVVHQQFIERSRQAKIKIHCSAVSVSKIEKWLKAGHAVMVLISSYRMNGDKAPHWVVVTACDDLCIYVHDPDPDTDRVMVSELDYQHIPVAKEDFAKMTTYGSSRFSAALLLKRRGC